MKKCPTLFTITEMQIKSTMRYHDKPITKVKRTDNTKSW